MPTPPILFLVFNRPKETAVVFEAIRKAKPRQLFVAADGPRANRPADADNCKAVRDIINQVDWECEVKTLFREHNMGCRNAVSEGISWFFDNVEEGIVLEDDCLPHPSFFDYCATLLAYYRDNEEVMHIGANNFQDGIKRGEGSYYFSKIPHIWGWASWRRAWQHYDVGLGGWKEFLKTGSKQVPFTSAFEKAYWMQTFNRVQAGEIDTWDYQWTYALMKKGGKAISPQVNMVSNIGFGNDATHNNNDDLSQLSTQGIENIIHPTLQAINNEADYYWYKKIIPWQLKLKNAVKFFLGQ